MPDPREGESQSDFIHRCVPIVMNEGTTDDNKQAVAICGSMWRRARAKKSLLTSLMGLFKDATAQSVHATTALGNQPEKVLDFNEAMAEMGRWDAARLPTSNALPLDTTSDTDMVHGDLGRAIAEEEEEEDERLAAEESLHEKSEDEDDQDVSIKREFSQEQRDRAAESGAAMRDGSFPIENKSDLHNAMQAVGRAKNPSAAKEHIRRRARALGLTGELSDAFKRMSWEIPLKIKKSDPDQRLIFGWASVVEKDGEAVVDYQDDIIPIAELEKAAYDFVLFSRTQGDLHDRVGVGRMVESMVFTPEKQKVLDIDLKQVGWWVGFKVDDDELWEAHKRGERPEFSIGGSCLSYEPA